jgi:hypothetical protein
MTRMMRMRMMREVAWRMRMRMSSGSRSREPTLLLTD